MQNSTYPTQYLLIQKIVFIFGEKIREDNIDGLWAISYMLELGVSYETKDRQTFSILDKEFCEN